MFPKHHGSGSVKGRHIAVYPNATEACQRTGSALPAPSFCLGAQACQARWLSRRDGRARGAHHPSWAGSLPAGRAGSGTLARTTRAAGARCKAGVLCARMWKNLATVKRLFPSDSVLFACYNKAQVRGNSSGLQYVKFCSPCQDQCRQFHEMIPCLLPEEQNVLLGDFTAIKLMPVANFKKRYHLND